MIGCYAQTELGHGSNVQKLETTAVFDPETDEFVLNTPTTTATKFWPGDMGRTANVMILYAALIIKGKHHGIHPFFVQIRDFQTHDSLPGITSGDIGPKVGFESKENSWLRLENVRIPRTNMLMKFTKVDREGNFKVDGDLRILYSVMMSIRTWIVYASSVHLAEALTISLRYATVRRQFATLPDHKKQERRLIDYQTHQFKLMPPLATSYAYYFSAFFVKREQNRLLDDVNQRKDFTRLPIMHHLTSTFKALMSWETLKEIEAARQACGGAGFLKSAGFWQIYSTNIANPTHEGDNTVLAHQGAKQIYKELMGMMKGEKVHFLFEYLQNTEDNKNKVKQISKIADFLDLDTLEACMAMNSSVLVYDLAQKMRESKASMKEKENELFGNQQVRMTMAHGNYVIFKIFRTEMHEQGFKPCVIKQLESLCKLFALNLLNRDCNLLFESGCFKPGFQGLLFDALK